MSSELATLAATPVTPEDAQWNRSTLVKKLFHIEEQTDVMLRRSGYTFIGVDDQSQCLVCAEFIKRFVPDIKAGDNLLLTVSDYVFDGALQIYLVKHCGCISWRATDGEESTYDNYVFCAMQNFLDRIFHVPKELTPFWVHIERYA